MGIVVPPHPSRILPLVTLVPVPAGAPLPSLPASVTGAAKKELAELFESVEDLRRGFREQQRNTQDGGETIVRAINCTA